MYTEDIDQISHKKYMMTFQDNGEQQYDKSYAMTQSHWLMKQHETQFPKHYAVAQRHELTRLRAPVEPITQRRQDTGPRSRSSSHTPRRRAAGEFSSQGSTFCADSYFGIRSTPVLPQQHVKDPGHSAKSAGGRLQLNTHTPYVCSFA